MRMTGLLEVRDLSVELNTQRGSARPVEEVNFSIDPGESLAIVGESGSGKTLTLRAVLGLLPDAASITGGSIFFEGTDLTQLTRRGLRSFVGGRIAMVFQEPLTALNPVMRIGDQIAEGPQRRLDLSRRAARRRTLDLLNQVGIPDPERRARMYPHQLSGGMRQRVMIAIALSNDPKIILCDEPTTALDVTIQDQILKLLAELRVSAGVGIVLVTHDLAVVAETCDRLSVMYGGRIIETGRVEDVFRSPRHGYTLQLLRSVPDFDRRGTVLSAIGGTPPDLYALPNGCRFHPRCQFATPDCRSGSFPTISVGRERYSACIHHAEVAASALEQPVIRSNSPSAEEAG